MKKTALIMAGGKGERFWPKSRSKFPKQFLSLTDDGKTMLQLTVERISPLVDLEDVFIATNMLYKKLVLDQLPGLPEKNIICEPVGKNTAPCIGLGAINILNKYEDATMIVLPSDHLIKNNEIFLETLTEACNVAESESNLVTIGITPNYPETGYGYINFDRNQKFGTANSVKRFVEKPNLDLAKEYLASGDYLWNSGMFIWKVSTILDNFQALMPDIYEGLLRIKKSITTDSYESTLKIEFEKFRSESIDYGIMEKAKYIFSIPGNFGWDDVGSWLAVGRIKENDQNDNVIKGNVITVNTSECIIEAQSKLIATVGLNNIIIVDTDDVTLVCNKENAGEIKQILSNLKEKNMNQYL